jgi:hypothetical protein
LVPGPPIAQVPVVSLYTDIDPVLLNKNTHIEAYLGKMQDDLKFQNLRIGEIELKLEKQDEKFDLLEKKIKLKPRENSSSVLASSTTSLDTIM